MYPVSPRTNNKKIPKKCVFIQKIKATESKNKRKKLPVKSFRPLYGLGIFITCFTQDQNQ